MLPIVLADADIHSAKARIQYVYVGKGKKSDAEMKEVESEHLEGIRETLDLYARFVPRPRSF